jgi:mono/diheme cytochrome c family protein
MSTRILVAAGAVFCAAVAWQVAEPARAASDLHRLPLHLAATGAFAPGNRSFAPQYPLWSDGMAKRRSIYLPPGTAIDASDPHDWTFPVGTKFWKEFSLNGRKVETRFLWKASDAGWVPAVYVWNEDGTDATLAPEDGLPGFIEVAPGKRHTIPSRADCAACHGSKRPVPLGFTALQLSTDRDPNAIHGEPLRPEMLTLETLGNERRLLHAESLLAAPPRIKAADPATRAVLGYLVANCSMCHNGGGEIAALAPVIRVPELLQDADAVARALVSHPTRWQVPHVREGESVLVHPGEPSLSAMLVRMRSRAPSSQMPPLGTVVRDQQAVDAVAAWIASRK